MNKNYTTYKITKIIEVLELSCVKYVSYFHRKNDFIIIKKTSVFQLSDVKCLHCVAREKKEIPDEAI